MAATVLYTNMRFALTNLSVQQELLLHDMVRLVWFPGYMDWDCRKSIPVGN